MDMKIKFSLKNFLFNEGILFYGIADAHHALASSEDISPLSILPEAKSIICYGVPIPRGIIYAQANELALYWRYCNMTYRSLDVVSNKLSQMLEQDGRAAFPVYSCYPWQTVNREFWGILPLVYWAERAGIGELSKCGLLVHPQYGSRILLGGVVTTRKLEPSHKLSEPVCPADCLDCVVICPAQAIAESGKVDHNRCIRFANSNPTLTHLLADPKVRENFSFETLVNTVSVDDHGSYACFECVKGCPLNKK
ncbi:hypothetical protein ACFL27_23845 [candidate division CSSED10-310 bacterium]|uniref:4Fe-4S ferredoxin-type domain-containing protein n=1 Tax=candidate division CSSED10-310 bacterium TaxID=2855610 RepID=A0ABV6Z4H3_UNCC1